MSWKKIAGAVGKAAPLLGTLLGGPVGGTVGGLIASALGVEGKPDAVTEALKVNPEAVIKLKKLELDHAAELQRLTLDHAKNALAEVNATMRVEAQSDHWWVSGWRPFWGFTSAIAFFAQAGAVAWLLFSGGNPELITALAALAIFWGVPLAIVGVTANGRSNEKIARITGQAPETILGAIATRLAGKAV